MRLTAGHEASRDRVEGIELDAVVSQIRKELRLYGAMESVVFALVDRQRYPSLAIAQLADPRDFPGGETRQSGLHGG